LEGPKADLVLYVHTQNGSTGVTSLCQELVSKYGLVYKELFLFNANARRLDAFGLFYLLFEVIYLVCLIKVPLEYVRFMLGSTMTGYGHINSCLGGSLAANFYHFSYFVATALGTLDPQVMFPMEHAPAVSRVGPMLCDPTSQQTPQ